MKTQLQQLIQQALDQLITTDQLSIDTAPSVQIERTRDRAHGDFACNIAMILAKQARRKPRDLAELIVAALPASEYVNKVEIAGPGFINFYLNAAAQYQVIHTILEQGESYGQSNTGDELPIQVEFVSTNPTGPLHVGHGRGAAYGATVANLLAAAGFNVQREYYINDGGRQMDILATSVWLRYLEANGVALAFPSNAYRGDYIREIAAQLQQQYGDDYLADGVEVMADLPADEPQGGDKEAHIDAVISRCKNILGAERYRILYDMTLDNILTDIRDDLEEFGVSFDNWFSERSLVEKGVVEKCLATLTKAGHIYEKEGAQWFASSKFGDEKDRVVCRDNGQTTYFASDIAYLADKFERGFAEVIYVWGTDHHGYIARLKAAGQALGYDPERIKIILIQFVNHLRGGERVQMSTRAGEFITLRDLRNEVGNDAARFFYVMRKHEQHFDFDLDLAKSQSKDNPVYYVQYAHARVCSVLAKLAANNGHYDQAQGLANLTRLNSDHEQAVLTELARYPEVIAVAAMNYDPHLLVQYLRDLANAFHSYYNEHQILVDDTVLRDARLTLSQAVRQVVANGLGLLGVSAPEAM